MTLSEIIDVWSKEKGGIRTFTLMWWKNVTYWQTLSLDEHVCFLNLNAMI